jgi:hypothetical protein
VNEVKCQINTKKFLISLQQYTKRGEATSEIICKHMNIDCERKPSGNEKRTDVNATGLLNYLPKCETIVSS